MAVEPSAPGMLTSAFGAQRFRTDCQNFSVAVRSGLCAVTVAVPAVMVLPCVLAVVSAFADASIVRQMHCVPVIESINMISSIFGLYLAMFSNEHDFLSH
jgi:hypothetical protein